MPCAGRHWIPKPFPKLVLQRSSASLSTNSSSPIIVSLRKVGGHLLKRAIPNQVSYQVTARPFSFLRSQSEFSLLLSFSLQAPIPYRHCVRILLRPVDHLRGAQNEYLVYVAALFASGTFFDSRCYR